MVAAAAGRRTAPRMAGHRPCDPRPGRARATGRRPGAARHRLRAVRLRPGPGRHGRVLRRVRVRAGGFREHDRGHRQDRPAALRRLRRRSRPNRLDVNRAVRDRLGHAQGLVRTVRVDRASITGMQIGGVTVFGLARPTCRSGSTARVMARERVVVGGGSRSWKVILAPADPAGASRRAAVVDGLATDPRPPTESGPYRSGT